MPGPANHDQLHSAPNSPGWWRHAWPKVKVGLQMIAGQLIGWAIRKVLGE
ncbi:hypothetical protein [Amycolatopsis keratiniphila]|nr:hypothetical protein [Amycolatopsis keratiniphila]SDU53986.1 hypothetical protein SAMN04489733_5723 [Amycolatopsis keratiniphila]